MKTNKILNIIFLALGILGCVNVFAQETKETQEIIIRKKGSKDTKVTVEITGNSILVNGKPLAEFKEDGITINNRKMIIREGDKVTMMLDKDGMKMLENIEGPNFRFDRADDGEMGMFAPSMQKRIRLGVITETKENEGVKIIEVMKQSSAETAGLLKDDIIYKVDDTKIATTLELSDYIKTKKDGDKIKVYFTRASKKNEVTATLESKNEMPDMKVFRYKDGGTDGRFSPRVFMDGIQNGDFEDKLTRRFGMPGTPKLGLKIQDTETEDGVKVLNVEAESISATAGLQKDDIIVGIGNKLIKNTDEARAALSENKTKTTYDIKVKRNGAELILAAKVPKKLKTANL